MVSDVWSTRTFTLKGAPMLMKHFERGLTGEIGAPPKVEGEPSDYPSLTSLSTALLT